MTRTARAQYAHAVIKDRSEAKNGMDKHIPKNGAGPHNWGRPDEVESLPLDDERADPEETAGSVTVNDAAERPTIERRLTPEELKEGMEVRKKALKSSDIDLGSIARSAPVISVSPKQSTPIVVDAETDAIATD